MDYLLVKTPDGRSYRHEIGGELLRIGRLSSNDLVLADSHVSRTHAEITRRDGEYYILDVGGRGGTFVNERPTDDPTLLRPGDRIQLGRTILLFNAATSSSLEFDDEAISDGSVINTIEPKSLRTPVGLALDTLGTPPAETGAQEGPFARKTGEGVGSLDLSAVRIIMDADRQLVIHRPLEEILERIMDLVERAIDLSLIHI